MNVPLLDEAEAEAADSRHVRLVDKQKLNFKTIDPAYYFEINPFSFCTGHTNIFIKAGFIKEIASF